MSNSNSVIMKQENSVINNAESVLFAQQDTREWSEESGSAVEYYGGVEAFLAKVAQANKGRIDFDTIVTYQENAKIANGKNKTPYVSFSFLKNGVKTGDYVFVWCSRKTVSGKTSVKDLTFACFKTNSGELAIRAYTTKRGPAPKAAFSFSV